MKNIATYRVTVTGSRGKSTVVRMLHAAFCACGLNTRTRLTGVLPRELHGDHEVPLLRPAGANIAELRWWLSTLPSETQAIITENSAVSPELQYLAAGLLKPQVTVFTNARPDHEAFWGETEEEAAIALSGALPRGGLVVMPEEVSRLPVMRAIAEKKELCVKTAVPLELPELPAHRRINAALALCVCSLLELPADKCLAAVSALGPDIADTQLISFGAAQLAFTFSINDAESTEEYFRSLGWEEKKTTFLYNHRSDREDRLRAFSSLFMREWRNILITGDRPHGAAAHNWVKVGSAEDFASLFKEGGQFFGCGNVVYGQPLLFKLALEKGLLKGS